MHKMGLKIYLHICGNSNPILEMMASTGVDAIEPLDPLGGVRLDYDGMRIDGTVQTRLDALGRLIQDAVL